MAVTPSYSCALPPSRRIAEYAGAAEEFGYQRVWLFDSPALLTDIWVALARAAEATGRIGLGTGVAVPSLRHPMVTASAIATIEELAPGRLVAAFGTGYTARLAMGRRPVRWAEVARYVRQVRDLLAGQVVEIDGAAAQMIHSPGYGPSRPVSVPVWLAASGPKGFTVARELGVEGILVIGTPPEQQRGWKHCAQLVSGTVVRPGEDHTSSRLAEAAGPAYVLNAHAAWEAAPEVLDRMPGGAEWRTRIQAGRPASERHLSVHEGHLCYLTERDRMLVEAAGPAILHAGWTGPPSSIAARFAAAGEAGVTEVLYAPTGPDIRGQLEAFANAAHS
jgi:5,10-methylenetetrahydromethanopterin reductase